jgi:hypothetical protein
MNHRLDKFTSALPGFRSGPKNSSFGPSGARNIGRAFCPLCCHPDGRKKGRESLSVGENQFGDPLANCFACGADQREVAQAIGFPASELFTQYTVRKAAGNGGPLPKIKGWDWWSLAAALQNLDHNLTLVLLQVTKSQQGIELSSENLHSLCSAVAHVESLKKEVLSGRK